MPVRRLDEDGQRAPAEALADPLALARYRAKVATVPGSECLWWMGAVSGRAEREQTTGGGRGRFWIGTRPVMIAHQFAYAVTHGVEALNQARLLGHRCHNPLCQRIAPEHVVVSSAVQNRREWAVQRRMPYSLGWFSGAHAYFKIHRIDAYRRPRSIRSCTEAAAS